MMRVFLVAPPGQARMDFAGMMTAYREFFGTEAQPMRPARSTMQVAGLVDPGWLVEIEVTAATPAMARAAAHEPDAQARSSSGSGAVGGYSAVYLGMEAMGLLERAAAAAEPFELPRGSGRGRKVVILGAGHRRAGLGL